MQPSKTITVSVVSSLIAFAVLLSGVHAKDLASVSLPAIWLDTKKQADETGQHIIKIASEAHHVEKVVKIQTSDTNGHAADSRSLRLLHDAKRGGGFRGHLADRLRLWWALNTLYLS